MHKEYKCERCGASPERKGFEAELDQESAAALRIAEVQTNFGVCWVLCIDCRRDWLKWLNTNPHMAEYSETGFRLDHWRTAHRKSGKEDVEKGLVLVRKMNELDTRLFADANDWFDAGKKPEKPPKLRVRKAETESDDDPTLWDNPND